MTACAQCGAALGVGRFCINCGHPVGTPVKEDADWRTTTAERPAVGPADPPPEPVVPLPALASHRHAGPRTRSSRPAWLVWAAGMLVLLLVAGFGAWLLLGGEDDPTTAASDTSTAGRTRTSEPTPSEEPSPTTSEPSPGTSEEPTEPAESGNVARFATADVPATADPNQDTQGNLVRYEGRNMLDGVPETTWRMPGDGTGETLTFDLDQPTEITSVGMINGYAKTARDGDQTFDWYAGNRRVLTVEWLFDDGTLVRQDLIETRALQSIDVDPVLTESVQVRLVTVSSPGTGPAARNYTAVSEVSLVGTPGA